jgi:folate-binding protein YgfZ
MGLLYADRSDRGKLRFTGPQRAWFLHQILTQAFEDMAPGEARDAAMITAHGRMIGYLEAVATEEAILAHFESSLSESLPDEVKRYVFATQVEVVDETEAMGLILVTGSGWADAAAAVAPDGAVLHPTRSLGEDAGYIWLASDQVGEVLARLAEVGERATESILEAIRITNGAPRWGHEMDVKTFPQEAGVDPWAVHYDKGCYLGQEAMAKIHFRGKVNRRLGRILGEGVSEGSDITLDDVKVGTVTSASGDRGLGLIRYTIEPGTDVLVGGAPAKVVG